MVVTKNYGKTEKRFRETCYKNGDNVSILTSDIRYTYVRDEDIETLHQYGWGDEEIDRIVREEERADDITRLAAWIREAGEIDHGFVIEDDPYLACVLDENNNYPEPTEVF